MFSIFKFIFTFLNLCLFLCSPFKLTLYVDCFKKLFDIIFCSGTQKKIQSYGSRSRSAVSSRCSLQYRLHSEVSQFMDGSFVRAWQTNICICFNLLFVLMLFFKIHIGVLMSSFFNAFMIPSFRAYI